jgi:predicted MFS family arabinose efflux permease
VLARVTPLARRPWIFSVRQTGNQLGAMAGSLLLPMLLLQGAARPFVFVAALALAVALWCGWLLRAKELGGSEPVAPLARADLGGLRDILTSPLLRLLTLTTVVFMATQVCLNLFVMSHAVRHWQLPVASAAGLVAVMQGAGLVGRLLWGRLAQRPGLSTLRLLGMLGLLMGSAGLALFLWPATPPTPALVLLLALLGLSASGWNGIMMAEIARVVGPARAGATSGAVLLFGYAGLALAPAGFAAFAAASGAVAAFATLLALAGMMGACIVLRSQAGARSLN